MLAVLGVNLCFSLKNGAKPYTDNFFSMHLMVKDLFKVMFVQVGEKHQYIWV